jgi:6,7-dimethyl-8-ribityllumazine synthase
VIKTLKATHKDFTFRTLVRNESNFDAIKALGSEVVKGSKEDHALVTDEAAKADVIVNVLDADDNVFIKAILSGAKKHHEATGKKSIFIHTSGSAVIVDGGSEGKANDTKIWDVRLQFALLLRSLTV